MTKQEVQAVVTDQIVRQLREQGRDILAEELHDDCDLLLSGLIDSLGLLELTAALEDYCGFGLGFDALDPEQMTIIGPLCDFVVAQTADKRALALD